jgi:tetratricopeptide (TPR) repeat protein
MKRAAVPGIPFLFSLTLSASTVGTHVYWQDSGYYLTAVRDLSVLYPHGFVLYLILCKVWTAVLAPLFGFALSVHLFSSLCAAGGAAVATLASRDFLRRLDPTKPGDLPAIGAGCVLAGGYCYGHAAIIAKTYALFTLLLAVLLWLLVRAERKRDFVAMGAVLGLSWAAHPAAALLVPGLLGYGWVRRDRIREWGWGFFAGVVGLAAGCAFLPCLLLPVLSARGSITDFAEIGTVREIVAFVSGQRFTRQEEAFGFSGWRWVAGLRYAWEELLLGIVPMGVGGWMLVRRHRGVAALLAGWVVPVTVVTLLFQGEGQFDQWLVFAYVPMALVTAAGFSVLRDRDVRLASGAAVVTALVLAIVNVPLLSQRGYVWAEEYGRLLLKNLDPGSVLCLSRDDSLAVCRYLQGLPGERTDVLPLNSSMLGEAWLDSRIAKRIGGSIPDYEPLRKIRGDASWEMVAVAAFANRNIGVVPAVFSDLQPSRQFLRDDLAVVPAGMLWKIAPRDRAAVDLKYWDYPIRPEDIPRQGRRARGHWNYVTASGTEMRPELYEDRLFLPLLWARVRRADLALPGDPAQALALYESVRRAYPDALKDPRFAYHLGLACYTSGRRDEAAGIWQGLLAGGAPAELAVFANFYLGELHRESGRSGAAADYYRKALSAGPPPELEKVLRERLQGR